MINIRIVREIEEAAALWRLLSPRETIFDDWDFRYAFYRETPYPLCFITAYEDDRPEAVGLLPLQDHPKFGFEFFAEDPCEENRPFIRPGYEAIIPQLFAAIPGRGKMLDISGDDPYISSLPLEDYKYVLPLEGIDSFDDFLAQRFNAKRRRSLAKELEAVTALKPDVRRAENEEIDSVLEALFGFNVSNFAGESYLLDEYRSGWRNALATSLDWRLLSVRINGRLAAASLSVLYNGRWDYLITGVDFKTYPGLGKYLVQVNIEAAIAAGARIFDAGLGDCGWKHLWHLDRIPQYELEVK